MSMSTKQTLIIAVAIMLGFLVSGLCQRYELVATSGDPRIIVLDKVTGHVWVRFQAPNQVPNEWTRLAP
jgi:hypothetical protein